jgi:hypothetical protein
MHPLAPPDSLLAPWRIFVNQERPRQKKNPRWAPLPSKEAVTVAMPEGSAYECIVNPLVIKAQPNEKADGIEAWALSRGVLCSKDGWHAWTESLHQAFVTPDGERKEPAEQTIILLRERTGKDVRETTVVLRADQRSSGEATKGPPKVAPGAPID